MARSRPGPLNLITDIAGLAVGQASDELARTGVTVILPDRRTACAVDSRGGAPGTRETDALAQENLVEEVDAIVLSGGSVYGLAAADAVVATLGAQGRGYSLASGAPPAPVVPAAILYDLANGGAKNWGDRPPYHGLGVAALQAASTRFELGSAGAGFGARAGGLQGGLGSTSVATADGFTVGAIAAVNSMGSVLVPGTRTFWASRLEIGGEFGRGRLGEARVRPDQWGLAKRDSSPGANTTIACVATDAALGRRELKRIAIMAHDGLAMAIRPCHTPFDGDVVFSLATGSRPAPEPRALLVARLGALAADCLARAVARAVYEARSRPNGPPAFRDFAREGPSLRPRRRG